MLEQAAVSNIIKKSGLSDHLSFYQRKNLPSCAYQWNI